MKSSVTVSNREYEACKKQFHHKNRRNLAVTLFLQIMVAAADVSLAFFIMMIVGAMEQTDKALFLRSMLFMLLIVLVFLGASTALKVVKNAYMKRALSQFKHYVFEKILKKSISEFNSEFSGKFISAFSNDLNSIEQNYLNGTIMIFHNCFMFLITIAAMAYINRIITICVLLGCLIPVAASLILSKKLVSKEKMTSDENASFVGQMKDLLNGFFVIKSFKAEAEVLKLFAEQNIQLEETKKERRETNDTMFIAGQISSIVVVLLIFVLGIYYTFKGTMTIASVLGCVQLSNFITEPVKQLVPLFSNRKAAVGLIEKLSDIIQEENRMEQNKMLLDGIHSSICIKEVTLSYDQSNVILDNISVTFEKGKSYAIVGGSGSGKSTLIKLLLGYFNDYKGEVKIDSYNLSDIKLESLYDIISVIQQNVFLFDKSIEDNITLFKEFDPAKMEKAFARSGLSQLIKEKGKDYNCGEGGCNLSGGEKQRISIARCLIRETPVLLMDEATAALDNETACQVENQILDIHNLTRIIVTHKLQENLLGKYDQIICLRDGKIVEQGSFDTLMHAHAYFYSLFNVSKSS